MILLIRIDATTLPALIFGAVLIVMAVLLGLFVWRARRDLDEVVEVDDRAKLHANRQFRRRLQISLMLGTIGILIPVGDQMDKLFVQRPHLFFVWVAAVFFLVLWMVLLAMGDWLSTITYSEIANAKLHLERRELEEQIRSYRAAQAKLGVDDIDIAKE